MLKIGALRSYRAFKLILDGTLLKDRKRRGTVSWGVNVPHQENTAILKMYPIDPERGGTLCDTTIVHALFETNQMSFVRLF